MTNLSFTHSLLAFLLWLTLLGVTAAVQAQTLTLLTPTYNCSTGVLEVTSSGGNGNTVFYQIPGLRGWEVSNRFTVPPWQRTGTTFTIQARQGDQVFTTTFTADCNANTPSTPSTPTPPPSTGGSTSPGFFVDQPAYDCSTGDLLVNTSGGNGSLMEYQILGVRGWSASNRFTIPSWQRQGVSFNIQVRQSGQVLNYNFQTTCNSAPPVYTPPSSAFKLLDPNYDCQSGQLSIVYANGDGSAVSYRIVELGGWTSNATFIIPANQRVGSVFTLEARLASGASASYTFRTFCPTPNSPVVLGPSTPLTFTVFFYCSTSYPAFASIYATGGTGSLVEYKVPGIRDWGTNAQFYPPSWQISGEGTTYTAYVRQSGVEYVRSFKAVCPYPNSATAARQASSDLATNWQVSALGNPVEDQLQVKLSGLAGQTVQLNVVDASGRTQSERQVAVEQEGQVETLRVGNSAGVYVLRAVSGGQQQALKVVKK